MPHCVAAVSPGFRLRLLPLIVALGVALPTVFALIHAAAPAPARAAVPVGFALIQILACAAAAALLGVRQKIASDLPGSILAIVLGVLALAGGGELLVGLSVGAIDPQRPAGPLAVAPWLMSELILPLGLAFALMVREGMAPHLLRRRAAWGSGAVVGCGALAMFDPGRALDVALPLLTMAGFGAATLLLLRGGDRDPLYPFLGLLSAGVGLDAVLIFLGLPVFTIGWYAVRGLELAAALALPTILTIDLARTALHLAVANRALAEMAERDALSGLANRRRFDSVLAQELIRARRSRKPLSVIMIDIDYFKRFNDGYGHLAGDSCLRAVAEAIGDAARRPGDLAARYGGEEFVLVLPETDLNGAVVIAEALQAAIADLDLAHAGSPGGRVTVSMGIASVARAELATPEALIGQADRALYRAKDLGRARWVSAA